MTSTAKVGGLVELLPCPFCGAAHPPYLYTRYGDDRTIAVRCNTCGASTADFPSDPATFSGEPNAIAAWNTRALSAHGGLLFTQADMERFGLHVADAREERLKSTHGQPVVDDSMVKRAEDYFYDNSPFNGPDELREGIHAMLVAALLGDAK